MRAPRRNKEGILNQLYALLEKKLSALYAFEENHAEMLERHRDLREGVEGTQEKIKGAVRTNYIGKPSGAYLDYEGRSVNVSVTVKHTKDIDADALVEAYPVLQEIPGLVVRVVDRKVLDELIKAGKISKDVVDQFTTERDLTPAVKFSPATGNR